MKFAIFSLLWMILISSCGFHLRGTAKFNFELVHLKSEAADTVANELKRLLIAKGVQVISMPKAAQATVHLRDETVERRVLTVSSTSGKQEEMEINYRVEMEVRRPDGTVILPKQSLSLLRDYRFDETAVLAMGVEEEALRKEMFRDLVAQIMRRLQAIKAENLIVTQLALEGLKDTYVVGEQFVVDLIEKSSRQVPVDIWVALMFKKDLWFVVPTDTGAKLWQLSAEPQPWRRGVDPSQTRHRILDFTVQPNTAGEYVLYAVYTAVGAELDLKNLGPTTRSTVVEGKINLENRSSPDDMNDMTSTLQKTAQPLITSEVQNNHEVVTLQPIKPVDDLTNSDSCVNIPADARIEVDISEQRLHLFCTYRDKLEEIKIYPVSTSKYGIGNRSGSGKTPLGKHFIKNKIGNGAAQKTIFKARRNTGRLAKIDAPKAGDLVTTRIMWLKGLEPGINSGHGIDSYKRYIYIHGTGEEGKIGQPASHGCIRMYNRDVVELFDRVNKGTEVIIKR